MTTTNTIETTTTTISSWQLAQSANIINHNTPTHNRTMSRNTYRKFICLWVQEPIKCEVKILTNHDDSRSTELTLLPNPNQLAYLNYLNNA